MDASRRGRLPGNLALEIAGVDPRAVDGEADEEAAVAAALRKARRRALLVVLLDWAALIVLLLLADPGTAFLDPGPGERGVFTLAVLAVAVHSGFRLGQLDKLRAAERVWREADVGASSARTGPPATGA